MQDIEVTFEDVTNYSEGTFIIRQGALQVEFHFETEEITRDQSSALADGITTEVTFEDSNGSVSISVIPNQVTFEVSRMTSMMKLTVPSSACEQAFAKFAKWHDELRT